MRRHLLLTLVLVLPFLLLCSCDAIMGIITPDPGVPGSPTASQGTYPDRIVLTWSAASGADGYLVYKADSATGPYANISSGMIDGTSADVTGVTPGVHYFYKVQAVNRAGEKGRLSEYAEGWAGLPTPTGLSASQGDHADRIELAWDAVDGAAGYGVYYATSEAGTYSKFDNEPTSPANTIVGVTGAVHYFFRVTAVDSGGNESSPSDAAEGWAASYKWQDDGLGNRQFFTSDPENYGTFFTLSGLSDLSLYDSMVVNVAKVSGDSGQDFGVLFYYVDQDNCWYLGINALGQWCLWKKVSGTWSTVQAWLSDGNLATGYATGNQLEIHYWHDPVDARYEHEFYFNGAYVNCLWDLTPMSGSVGFGVQVGSASEESLPDEPVDVRFLMTSPVAVPDVAAPPSLRQAAAGGAQASSSGAGGYPARGR